MTAAITMIVSVIGFYAFHFWMLKKREDELDRRCEEAVMERLN